MASTTPTPMPTSSVVPKRYCTQLQSPLYRLPRELRDQIYEYYLSEEDGYHYDSAVKKFLYQNPSTTPRPLVVRLGLRIACRIASEETKSVAFPQLNFRGTGSIVDDIGYQGLRSRAGRFECLLGYVENQKCRMLILVAQLLHREDFDVLFASYPSVETWYRRTLQEAMAAQRNGEFADPRDRNEDIRSLDFNEALHHALMLVKVRYPPTFEALASTTFGMRTCPIRSHAMGMPQHNIFTEGALPEILHWLPEPWCLPEEGELAKMEALVCQTTDPGGSLFNTNENGTRYFDRISRQIDALDHRWYFSAAAVAINFLRRSSKQQRDCMRTIFIDEEFKAVSRPVSHARGFIPFCLEHPKLHIVRHIGIVRNLLPARIVQRIDVRGTTIMGSHCLDVMVPWIEETLSLASYGMPVHSFQLRIDGRGTEAAEAWKLLKYVAATQEALLRQRKASGGPLEPRPAPLHYADCLLRVWSLPAGFAQMIRDIAERKSMVYYDGEVGELWDEEEFFQQRKDWTDDDWEEDWKVKVTFTEAIATDCWPSIFNKYSNLSKA